MFLLLFMAAGLLFGFLCRGSLRRLVVTPIHHAWLVALALLMEIIIFSSSFESSPWSHLSPPLYVLANLILILFIGLNLSLGGLKLVGIGLLLNLLVISANGGRMPASPDQLAWAGLEPRAEELQSKGYSSNLTIMTAETRLAFLADIFALPAWFPLHNVFSLGDLLIGAGAFVLIWRGMVAGGGRGARI